MSWRKQRVYKCDICGNEGHTRTYEPGRVPLLWNHTGNRHGFTICGDCQDAVKWAAKARKEQEQEQGGERYGGLVGALQTMLYGGANDGKED